MGQKFEVFWGFRRGKILTLTIRPPRKSIPTETRHLTQKRCRSVQNCGLQRRARNSIKKYKKIKKEPHLTFTFHPFVFWINGAPRAKVTIDSLCVWEVVYEKSIGTKMNDLDLDLCLEVV